MRHLILDVETIQPDWDDEEQFAPLPLHEPVVISAMGVATGAEDIEMISWRMDKCEEREALEQLGELIVRADRLVTFNGRGFDMPLLGMRAAACGAKWRHWIDRRHRFPNFRTPLYHYDLLDQYGDYNARKFKFDALCQLMGLPGKGEVDGRAVGRMWAGTWSKPDGTKRPPEETQKQMIVDYCEQDVFDAWVCYLKFVQAYERDIGGAMARTRDWAAEIPHLAGRIK